MLVIGLGLVFQNALAFFDKLTFFNWVLSDCDVDIFEELFWEFEVDDSALSFEGLFQEVKDHVHRFVEEVS